MLTLDHCLVDGCDPVGIRLDLRPVDGQDGVEQMGQFDAVGFGDKAKQSAVPVEAPGTALLNDLDLRFGVPAREAGLRVVRQRFR